MLMDIMIVAGTSAAVIGLEKAIQEACRRELHCAPLERLAVRRK